MRVKRPVFLAIVLCMFALVSYCDGQIMFPGNVPPRVKKQKPKPDFLPSIPTLSATFAIPVAPLGYGAPSPTYLGRHYSLFTLDFLDEDRILFTLRAPGLLARDATEANTNRQVKAVVLKLPDQAVEAQALWSIPDRGRYLWMLKDNRFLLRDRNGFEAADSSLKTTRLFQLPGQFLSLQVDPSQKLSVAASLDPPSTDVSVRIVDLDSGQVRQTSHARTAPELPINSDGYLETVHDEHDHWSLRLNAFDGTQKVLGHIASNCLPNSSFIGQEILVTGCNPSRIPTLTAISMAGQVLWQSEIPVTYVPPLLVTAANGSRFVRETIVLKKAPAAGSETLWVKAVRGQVARVYDATAGKILLEVPINPVLDGGGNVAISPSGRRVAVLNDASIQIYELPEK